LLLVFGIGGPPPAGPFKEERELVAVIAQTKFPSTFLTA